MGGHVLQHVAVCWWLVGATSSLLSSGRATNGSSPVQVQTIARQARAGQVSPADARVADVSGGQLAVERLFWCT